ncbi:hypothetical protein Peur_037626 [Populus x canadensis]
MGEIKNIYENQRIRIALQAVEVEVEMRLENGCWVHHSGFPTSVAYASGSNFHFYFQIYDIYFFQFHIYNAISHLSKNSILSFNLTFQASIEIAW